MRLFAFLILLLAGLLFWVSDSDYPTKHGGAEGTLPNGIKYYVQETPWIKGKVSIGMVVKTGSIYETQDEIGCAHFLEHMCFKSVPGYNGVDRSLDIVFHGGLDIYNDWQAFTSDCQTVYKFTYPVGDEVTHGEIVNFLDGVLSGMEFDEDAVDKERLIILKETETSYSNNSLVTFSGSYFENHRTLGDSAQIAAITAEKLDGFYRKWYRPENIALVMAGNESAEKMEQQLKKAFWNVKCVVDSALPTMRHPMDERNIDLYTNPSNFRRNKGVGAILNYRFPRTYIQSKDSIRVAIAREMACNLLKGTLEQNKGFKVNTAINSGHGKNSSSIINFECKDSTDFKAKLLEIGHAVAHLKYVGAEPDFIQEVWSEYKSFYLNAVRIDSVPELSSILSGVFKHFTYDMPYTDQDVFNQAINAEVQLLTAEDIRAAAQYVFDGNYGLVAAFPDYGLDWQDEVLEIFTAASNNKEARVELSVPQKVQFKKPDVSTRKMLAIEKPDYNSSSIAHQQIYSNGLKHYTLGNGLQIVWLKNSLNNSLLLKTNNGIQNVPAQDRAFLRAIKSFQAKGIGDIDEKLLDKQLYAWGLNRGLNLKLNEREMTGEMNWNADNAEFAWQYLYGLFTHFGIGEYEYKQAEKQFAASGDKGGKQSVIKYFHLMTGNEEFGGDESSRTTSKDETTSYLNGLLDPAKTTLYIQGETDIESLITWLNGVPAKNNQVARQGQSWLPKSDMLVKSDKLKGNTWMVNRCIKLHQDDWTFKKYLINGMFEEYMCRKLLKVLRNEKGLVYAWGTSSYAGVQPQPYTTVSLRYKIIPELLEQSLTVLDEICFEVKTNGISQEELVGLKNREWNRYLDSWNDERGRLKFLAYQEECNSTLWDDEEFRQAIQNVTIEELNQYVQQLLAQSSVTMIY